MGISVSVETIFPLLIFLGGVLESLLSSCQQFYIHNKEILLFLICDGQMFEC
jgi:hypothetical protein